MAFASILATDTSSIWPEKLPVGDNNSGNGGTEANIRCGASCLNHSSSRVAISSSIVISYVGDSNPQEQEVRAAQVAKPGNCD
ncbi:hypothetical protein SLEP1_g17020 [Rubroshorea leprosula]|uniref:Uncharacterized protein n=1 Tax=Rubroshorea leprosula TaxID=152421 RepID=A0AAV5J0F6_9ROSI|nr:hypothetical protein SLEP1_g17020 [Rubroshorea leprosula]